jgi:hypothetical protein
MFVSDKNSPKVITKASAGMPYEWTGIQQCYVVSVGVPVGMFIKVLSNPMSLFKTGMVPKEIPMISNVPSVKS